MVIVLLRSGGILDTHKREFIDPVDLGNFKKKISTEKSLPKLTGTVPKSGTLSVILVQNFGLIQ